MTPRMPKKLTAIPNSTIVMRTLTLDVIVKLSKPITKPSRVINIPAKIIAFSSFLLLVVLPGFALQKEHD